MSVRIDVCKDIEKYQESLFAGFNLKQTLVIGAALAVGASTAAVCIFILNIPAIISGYLMLPVCIPIILIGFSNKDGMGYLERRRRKRSLKKMNLYNISTESYGVLGMFEEEQVKEEKKAVHSDKQPVVMLTAASVAMVLFFAAIIAVILIFK